MSCQRSSCDDVNAIIQGYIAELNRIERLEEYLVTLNEYLAEMDDDPETVSSILDPTRQIWLENRCDEEAIFTGIEQYILVDLLGDYTLYSEDTVQAHEDASDLANLMANFLTSWFQGEDMTDD